MVKVLAFAMSNEVRSQDTVFVISSVSSSKLGRDLAWTYFKDNWDLFNERFKGAFLLVRLVKSLTENFASEEKAIEIDNFFKVKNFTFSFFVVFILILITYRV